MHPFRVGIADVVPKAIAYQLLAPALTLAEPVKLVCQEDRLEQLAAELSIHRLDMVLADRPLPSNMDIKGYSHPLGECGIAFLAARAVADTLKPDFPANLHDAPLLIPGEDSALRVPLLRWLERHGIQPTIVGEFDDSALMSAFGQAGAGVFPVPLTTAQEVMRQYQVVELGQTLEIRERFFAISVERRLESSGGAGGQRSGAAQVPAAGCRLRSSVSSQCTASAGVMIRKTGAQRRRSLSTARSLLTSASAPAAAASSMNFWSSGSLQRGIRLHTGLSP